MRRALFDFRRFLTPHTGEEACSLPYDIIEDWDINYMVTSVTTDNESHMLGGVTRLHRMLFADVNSHFSTLAEFPPRCIVHVVNLAMK